MLDKEDSCGKNIWLIILDKVLPYICLIVLNLFVAMTFSYIEKERVEYVHNEMCLRLHLFFANCGI